MLGVAWLARRVTWVRVLVVVTIGVSVLVGLRLRGRFGGVQCLRQMCRAVFLAFAFDR